MIETAYVLVSAGALFSLVLIVLGCLCWGWKSGFSSFQDGDPEVVATGYTDYRRQNSYSPPAESTPEALGRISFDPLPDVDVLAKRASRSSLDTGNKRLSTISLSLEGGWQAAATSGTAGLDFPRNQIQFLKEVGTGWFGQVLQAEAYKITLGLRKSRVVIKMLSDNADLGSQIIFMKEIKPYRDFAIRNCQVSMEMNVKIGDYGIAQDTYKGDYYYPDGDDVGFPIRWMSPECLDISDELVINSVDNTMSTNIWSFGVALWEIIEFGRQPCSSLSDQEVLRHLKDNQLVLERPLTAVTHGDKLYEVVQLCMTEEADRPTLESIHSTLEHLVNKIDTDTEAFDQKWNQLLPKKSPKIVHVERTNPRTQSFESDFVSGRLPPNDMSENIPEETEVHVNNVDSSNGNTTFPPPVNRNSTSKKRTAPAPPERRIMMGTRASLSSIESDVASPRSPNNQSSPENCHQTRMTSTPVSAGQDTPSTIYMSADESSDPYRRSSSTTYSVLDYQTAASGFQTNDLIAEEGENDLNDSEEFEASRRFSAFLETIRPPSNTPPRSGSSTPGPPDSVTPSIGETATVTSYIPPGQSSTSNEPADFINTTNEGEPSIITEESHQFTDNTPSPQLTLSWNHSAPDADGLHIIIDEQAMELEPLSATNAPNSNTEILTPKVQSEEVKDHLDTDSHADSHAPHGDNPGDQKTTNCNNLDVVICDINTTAKLNGTANEKVETEITDIENPVGSSETEVTSSADLPPADTDRRSSLERNRVIYDSRVGSIPTEDTTEHGGTASPEDAELPNVSVEQISKKFGTRRAIKRRKSSLKNPHKPKLSLRKSVSFSKEELSVFEYEKDTTSEYTSDTCDSDSEDNFEWDNSDIPALSCESPSPPTNHDSESTNSLSSAGELDGVFTTNAGTNVGSSPNATQDTVSGVRDNTEKRVVILHKQYTESDDEISL